MGPPSPSEHDSSLPSPEASTDETIVGDDGGVRPRVEPRLGRGDDVGRYLLLEPLGRGAMGQVFRAYDPDLDRQVAIKILFERGDSDSRSHLLREAMAMARIHHPHVITVYDAGMHEGSVFIAMEIVDGPSLDRWLETARSPDEILDVLIGAARGLAAAHAAGVVHRDFKPANVLVGTDGRAKVGDFGLARIEDLKISRDRDKQAPHAMGTPAYMSPEHFAGVRIDARSDQFSFAIALHEALHGTRPFSATTLPQLAAQVTTGAMTPPPTARRGGIDAIVRRALSVDPTQRFESMEALIAAIVRARQPLWRRWAVVGAATVAAGLLIFGLTQDATEVEPCVPGAERVDAVWNDSTKAALQIGGSDYTESYARQVRERFVTGLDDYAARWSATHDESCAAVGPRAQRGTPPERHTAECLDNRLDSLQGLAELAVSEPIDAARVDDLVGTLPSLEQCTAGGWIPYPTDPEAAAQAAALHRALAKIRRAQLMDHNAEVVDEARVAVEQARALGEPYLVALALTRQARVLEDTQEVAPLLDEALQIAVAHGFDWLGADIINNTLLATTERQRSWRELQHLVAVARGLVERSGGDENLLGNLALNEASVLRGAGRLEEASLRDREAELHFERNGDRQGIASARTNQAITSVKLGRFDEAIPQLRAAVQELEEVIGPASPKAIQAQQALARSLALAARPHEAFPVAAESLERVRKLYAPGSHSLRQALTTYVALAVSTGELARAREGMASLRELPPDATADAIGVEILTLELMLTEGRYEELLRLAPELRVRWDAELQDEWRAYFELYSAEALFMLGRRAEVRDALAHPAVRNVLRPDQSEELRMITVLLATLTAAPPLAGTPWREQLPAESVRPSFQRLRKVIDAFEGSQDPTPVVRRMRDELAASYHDHDPYVQLLDAWLASPERPPQ